MIDFFRELPAWLLDHPWLIAASIILCMTLATLSILLNPDGRQLGEKLRHRR
jgi:hypothetical protein